MAQAPMSIHPTRFLMGESVAGSDRLSAGLPAGAMALTLILGWLLMTAEVPELQSVSGDGSARTQVSLETVRLPVMTPPEPEPVPTPRPEPEEIPRLDSRTILAAPEDRPVPTREEPTVVAPQSTPADEQAPTPRRRVYGVRKVYARGLGSGGQGTAGLVTKLGNTLDGVADTLTATTADLQGELAALSTIDRAPEPVRRIKPVYSPEMLKARARGDVTAYLLVDTDGSVKDVKVTRDIGFDSRQVATAALREFLFKPALKDGSPVAVWILHRIRFEFQE